MSDPSARSPFRGKASLFTLGSQHLELIRLEWALEKIRYRQMFNLLLIGAPLFICSLLALGALVLILSWDTRYRILTAIILLILYSAGTLYAAYRLHKILGQGGNAFADTRREFNSDLAMLRDRLNT